jgi:SAM-dependent methyltransferase
MTSDQQLNKANEFSIRYHSDIMDQTDNEHKIVTQSERSHMKRFNAMLRLGDFNGKTVLDVGCGLGAFYNFLKHQGINADYYGVDINKRMVEGAKKHHPEIADRFSVFDIIAQDMGRQFDYVVAVGILNLNFGRNNNLELTARLSAQAHKHSRIGYAVGMTSALSRKPSPETYYYKPEEVLPLVTCNCSNFIFDHSYMPHDFTVHCYVGDFYGNKP